MSPVATKAVLIVTLRGKSSRIELTMGNVATLGRTDECTVLLDDRLVSRRHAEFRLTRAGLEVMDLGSHNGTLLITTSDSSLGETTAVPCETHLAANRWYPIPVDSVVQVGGALIGFEHPRQRLTSVQDDTSQLVISPVMLELYGLAERIAHSDLSVLVLGESGVGKDVLARFIHRHSLRGDQRLVSINCGAVAENLLESELFGYEKGAFTGADAKTQGLLETADGSTFFLDEVGALTPAFQIKLLRVLESQQFMRVGGRETITVDIRYIAATNRDLLARVALGKFREDLYYRLNGITLTIPPLRERVDEIVPLAERFLHEYTHAKNTGDLPYLLTAEAKAKLLDYPWPGNVRQLRNVVHRAAVLSTGNTVGATHIQLPEGNTQVAPSPTSTLMSQKTQAYPGPTATSPEALRAQAEQLQKQRIIDALATCAGNQTRAAALLGMTRRVFVTQLKKYNIPRPRARNG